MKLCCFQYSVLFHVRCTEMIESDHELPDWTETVRNEPILSETDVDNIKAIKLIMGHQLVACEDFYVDNNIVIYLERKKTVPVPKSYCTLHTYIRHATGFLDLHLSVANGFVSSKIYDTRDDFDFDIVNFPFLDGDVPRRASYGVYIFSQLIRFARVCNHVTDFNARNKCLTAKLLQQGYRYCKLRKTFSKFYRRHYELISKYNVGLTKVQVGKDQENAQSEKDSHSKN